MVEETVDRIVTMKKQEEDQVLDKNLRPRRLTDFIGQEKVKDNLKILIEAAKSRGEPV